MLLAVESGINHKLRTPNIRVNGGLQWLITQITRYVGHVIFFLFFSVDKACFSIFYM
jgi:hypothetical protein